MSMALPAFIFGQKELTKEEEKIRVDIKQEKNNAYKRRQDNDSVA